MGVGGGSATRIDLPGVALPPRQQVNAASRAWVEIPPALMTQLAGKSFGLRVHNDSGNAVAIGAPRFARVNLSPNGKLLGNPSFTNGPDKLGAGLLGFDALAVQQQTVLAVMNVRPDTAAAALQLRQGDVILAVRGRPLPVNHAGAGWEWFHHSHEATIGRATEAALKAGENKLSLTVLRDGKPEDIDFPLKRRAAFSTLNPANDPEAARMLDDCLAFLIRTQRADGSWSNCIIRTCFSALALLATGGEEHIERVRKAVEWSKARYKQPANYGGLGFWYGSYAAILYSEWHLAWEPGHGLRFTTPHHGAHYMGEEDLINAAYALVLQGPRRSLHLTGKTLTK